MLLFTRQNGDLDTMVYLWRVMGGIAYAGVEGDKARDMAALGFSNPLYGYIDRAQDYPDVFHFSQAGDQVILISGANVANGKGFVGSPIAGHEDTEFPGFNKYAGDAARQLVAHLSQLQFRFGDRVQLVGHSFGGCIALAIALGLQANGYDGSRLRVVTVGSPRPGDAVIASRCQTMNLVRFFGHDDIVPKIVPHGDESPLIHGLMTAAASGRVNGQVQPHGGARIEEDGAITNTPLPDETFGDATVNIADWLTQFMLGTKQTHSWARYTTLFGRSLTRRGATPIANVGGANNIEDLPIPHSSRNTPAVRAAVQAYVDLGRQGIGARRTIGPKALMTVEKNGPFYSVVWCGGVIATYTKRRDANKHRTLGNAMIKRWQRAADVPSDGWNTAATEFLGFVSGDESVASPSFNVTGSLA